MDYKVLLQELLDSLKLSKKKFAETIGASQGNVSDWFNKPNARPSIDALKRISDTHNVNLNWLITGTGSMFNTVHAREPAFSTGASRSVHIAVVADIAAGTGIEAYDLEPSTYIDLSPSLLPLPGPYWAFRIVGDSMEPFLYTDDLAVITRSWYDLDYNGQICAFRSTEGLLIKRVFIAPKAKYGLLIPLNPAHKIIKYDRNSPDLTMLGVLVASIRQYNHQIDK